MAAAWWPIERTGGWTSTSDTSVPGRCVNGVPCISPRARGAEAVAGRGHASRRAGGAGGSPVACDRRLAQWYVPDTEGCRRGGACSARCRCHRGERQRRGIHREVARRSARPPSPRRSPVGGSTSVGRGKPSSTPLPPSLSASPPPGATPGPAGPAMRPGQPLRLPRPGQPVPHAGRHAAAEGPDGQELHLPASQEPRWPALCRTRLTPPGHGHSLCTLPLRPHDELQVPSRFGTAVREELLRLGLGHD